MHKNLHILIRLKIQRLEYAKMQSRYFGGMICKSYKFVTCVVVFCCNTTEWKNWKNEQAWTENEIYYSRRSARKKCPWIIKVEGQDHLKMHLLEQKINGNPFQKLFEIFVGQDTRHAAFWGRNVRPNKNNNRNITGHNFFRSA